MARNSEKAMLMLNRWHEMKLAVTGGIRRRRPRNTEEVDSVRDGEFWRNNIVRQLSIKVAEIQNAGLGEAKLRELNDEINQLLKEKTKWETQISKLGGPDYSSENAAMFEGGCVTTRDGYRYFGAAKDLKSVKEMQLVPTRVRTKTQTRADLANRINPSYYGWWVEEMNPKLVELESSLEAKLQREAEIEYNTVVS